MCIRFIDLTSLQKLNPTINTSYFYWSIYLSLCLFYRLFLRSPMTVMALRETSTPTATCTNAKVHIWMNGWIDW